MIEKQDILKMAKHVFKRSHGANDHNIMHPYRDWAVGLVVAATIFVLGAIYAFNVYISFDNFDIVTSDPAADTVSYKEAQVSAAIELYEERAIKFAALVESMPTESEVDTATTTENAEEGGGDETESSEAEADEEVPSTDTVEAGETDQLNNEGIESVELESAATGTSVTE